MVRPKSREKSSPYLLVSQRGGQRDKYIVNFRIEVMIKCQFRHNMTFNSDLKREEIRDLKVHESKEIRTS